MVLIATALMLVGIGRSALSQERRLLARSQDPVLLEEIDEALPLARMVLDQDRFDLRILGPDGDVDAARKRVETILRGRVESLAYSYRLTETQKKKLLVAGQGDIKRFFDSVQEARAKLPLLSSDQDRLPEMLSEIRRLARSYRSDLFSSGSIFAKTLSKTLNEEQSTRFRERKRQQFRATLAWVAGTLEQTMKLTSDQRRRLEKLLIEETRPPEAFGSHDYYGLIFQAARIPEAKLKPIFDDDQWQALTRQFREVRGMEKTLRDGGYLPMDEAAADRSVNDRGEALEEPHFFQIPDD
jgi:hypothetical protein